MRPLFLVDLVDFLIDWICSLFVLYLMELRRDRKFDKIEEKSHQHKNQIPIIKNFIHCFCLYCLGRKNEKICYIYFTINLNSTFLRI